MKSLNLRLLFLPKHTDYKKKYKLFVRTDFTIEDDILRGFVNIFYITVVPQCRTGKQRGQSILLKGARFRVPTGPDNPGPAGSLLNTQ